MIFCPLPGGQAENLGFSSFYACPTGGNIEVLARKDTALVLTLKFHSAILEMHACQRGLGMAGCSGVLMTCLMAKLCLLSSPLTSKRQCWAADAAHRVRSPLCGGEGGEGGVAKNQSGWGGLGQTAPRVI